MTDRGVKYLLLRDDPSDSKEPSVPSKDPTRHIFGEKKGYF
jgi:hypothetical protein